MYFFSFLVSVLFFISANVVEASSLDYYKSVINNNRMTIKYENITPLQRNTNRTKVSINGKSGMNLDNIPILTNRQFNGLVVIDGEDKYEEITCDDISMCCLTKGDKVYFFTKKREQDKYEYYGNEGKGKVSASGRNLMAEFMQGITYADPHLTHALLAITPLSKIPKTLPVFSVLGTGVLDGGLIYEDYYTKSLGVEEGVRYYLEGNKLVKISIASLKMADDGKEDFSKIVLKISSFSDNPVTEYLKLPDGLREVSK